MKSNKEWKLWGKTDPLFAVSSWAGKEKGGAAPWTNDEFYALGKSDWDDFFAHWTNYGCNINHCIEIGCGAGRLTKHISGVFESVTALDVSEDQIAYAKSKISATNIHYRLTDGVHFAAEVEPATALFSAHVFQHFDTFADAEHVFYEIYQALIPGGTTMIHLPIYLLPETLAAPLMRRLIALTKSVGNLKADLNRRRGKLIMRGLAYERSRLANCFTKIGFQGVEFCTFQVRSNKSWHDFIMAKKPTK